MTIEYSDLFAAILSMDSYNRGYDPAIDLTKLSVSPSQIGDTTIVYTNGGTDAQHVGFYAIAYQYTSGDITIAYRGTDQFTYGPMDYDPSNTTGDPNNNAPAGGDVAVGWAVGTGSLTLQAQDALASFTAVQAAFPTATISVTGHSLGGGLAGLVSADYGLSADLFETMKYQAAATNAFSANHASTLTGPVFNQSIYDVQGQALTNGFGVPLGGLPASSPDQNLTIGSDVTLPPIQAFDLHDAALTVMLMYSETSAEADDKGSDSTIQADSWTHAAQYFWPVLYDNTFAAEIGMTEDVLPGRYGINNNSDLANAIQPFNGNDSLLREILAYSAIGEGQTVFGNTGIHALFNDANDLGAALNLTDSSSALSIYATNISQVFVEFAGEMALRQVLSTDHPEALQGVLTFSNVTDDHTLAISFDGGLWETGATSLPSMTGQANLVNAIVSSSGDAPAVLSEMEALWGNNAPAVVEQVVFATTNDGGEMDVEDTASTSQASIIMGGDGADVITVSAYPLIGPGENLFLTGKGDDTVTMGDGKDIAITGDGNGTINIDASTDSKYVDGGAGSDTVSFSSMTDGVVFTTATDGSASVQDSSHTLTTDPHDTLVSVEHIVLTDQNDTALLSAPVDGQHVTLDGAGGTNTFTLTGAADDYIKDFNTTSFDNADDTGHITLANFSGFSQSSSAEYNSGAYAGWSIPNLATGGGIGSDFSAASGSAIFHLDFNGAEANTATGDASLAYVYATVEGKTVQPYFGFGDAGGLYDITSVYGPDVTTSQSILVGTNHGDTFYIDGGAPLTIGEVVLLTGTGNDTVTIGTDGAAFEYAYTGGNDNIVDDAAFGNGGGVGDVILPDYIATSSVHVSFSNITTSPTTLADYFTTSFDVAITVDGLGTIDITDQTHNFFDFSGTTPTGTGSMDLVFRDGTYDRFNSDGSVTTEATGTSQSVYKGLWSNDVLTAAGSSSDTLYGMGGDDTLTANNGGDTLYAGEGNDTLVAGTGHDILFGGSGTDVYSFKSGDGQDTIVSGGGTDKITFDSSVHVTDVHYIYAGPDLWIEYGSGDTIIVKDALSSPSTEVDFSDGTVHNASEIILLSQSPTAVATNISGSTAVDHSAMPANVTETVDITSGDNTYDGGSGDNSITTGTGSDVVYGGIGHNTYLTGAGETTIYGGTGDETFNIGTNTAAVNDTYYGGGGENTYHFNSNFDGEWTVFGGTSPGDSDAIYLPTFGSTETLHVGNSGGFDYATFDDSIGYLQMQNVETLVLGGDATTVYFDNAAPGLAVAGGTANNVYYGSTDSDTIFGGTGDDSIFGNGGEDTISGGQGNDYISGADNDIYLFANGDGQDVLTDSGVNNTIAFDSSVAVSSVSYSQSSNDLIIHYGSGTDEITVSGFFDTLAGGQIEQVVFADGTIEDQHYIAAYIGGHVPTPVNDTVSASSSDSASGNALTNDTDPDSYTLYATPGTFASAHGGDVVMNADGSFTYEAATGFRGTDTFTYIANDGVGGFAQATVTVSDVFTNQAPVAQDDVFSAASTGSATGNVLTNDVDPDGDTMTVTAATLTTAHGATVVVDSDGSFTYDAVHGYSGNDTFSYTVADYYGATATAGVTIDNILADHAPTAVNDSVSASSTGSASGNVLTNDSDSDGDAFAAVAGTFTSAHGGDVVMSADGSFTYTAADGYRGTDTFTYTNEDTLDVSSTATVTVSDVFTNHAPVANGDTFDAANTGSVSGNVLTNDSDADGDAITVTAATLTTAHGATVIVHSDGSFTYDAVHGYSGGDSFTYSEQDAYGATASAGVTIDNVLGDHLPVAQDDTFTTTQGTGFSGNVLSDNGHGADSDADGDTLTVTAATLTTAHGGDVVLNTDGSFDYTPASTYAGSDGFTYTLSDGEGGSVTGHVAITVTTHAPTANDDTFSGSWGSAITGNVLSNDTDPDGDTLSVVQSSVTTDAGNIIALSSDGSFSYTPSTGSVGNETFTYTASDGHGGTSDGTVTLTVDTPSGATVGTSGDDTIIGSGSPALIFGLGGNDVLTAGSDSDTIYGGSGADTINGGSWAATLAGGAGNDTYIVSDSTATILENSGEGTDLVMASATFTLPSQVENLVLTGPSDLNGAGNGLDNVITGNSGWNVLSGGAGNDTLIGGAGNDSLSGGTGNDTYSFSSGDGQDHIYENASEGTDTIAFHGIDPSAVTMTDNTSGQLMIKFGTTDVVTVENGSWNSSTGFSVGNVELVTFDDGTTLSLTGGLDLVASYPGSAFGTSYGDTLTASGPYVTLCGYGGDDTMTCSSGGSTLYGGTGNDTYSFSSGDGSTTYGGAHIFENASEGTDTIAFHGIDPSAVTMTDNTSGQLMIQFGTTDIVTVENGSWNSSTGFSVGNVELVTFDDGTTLSLTGGLDLVASYPGSAFGTSFGDTLTASGPYVNLWGYGGDDTMTCSSGGSTLYGGTGNDTYSFSSGDGSTTYGGAHIFENASEGTDTIAFHGIDPSAVTMTDNSSGQLMIQFGTTDFVTVENGSWNSSTGFSVGNVELVTFDDGTTLSLTGGLDLVASYPGSAFGTSYGDTLTASGPYVNLWGYGGDDTLTGSGGSTLYGGTGNDTYSFGAGDATISEGGAHIYENASEGTDTIAFHGIDPSAVTMWSNTSGELFIQYSSTDEIVVENGSWNSSTGFSVGNVERITFDDSAHTVWDLTSTVLVATTSGQSVLGSSSDDTLTAESSSDNLSGYGGDDLLIASGSSSSTDMYGMSGADTFKFEAGTTSNNVEDFSISDGDKLDFSAMMTGFDPAHDSLSDWIQLTETGGNTVIAIDADGTGGTDSMTTVATLVGVTGLGTVLSLITDGTLKAFDFTPPSAVSDTVSAGHTDSASGNVLTNDTDPYGTALTVTDGTFASAHGGTVIINADGSFTYEAASGYGGTDSFTYSELDGYGQGATGTVTVTAINANHAPVAADDTFTGSWGSAITGNVLSNDTDADSDTLHVVQSTVTTTAGNDVTLDSDGSFSYTPPADFLGSDTFTYTASDGNGGTDDATVTLTVNAPSGALVGTSGADTMTGTNSADLIFGQAGNDVIHAQNGVDTIYGGAGNDTIDGGNGADTMAGGAGDDTYYVDNTSDVVTENAGQGTDTVVASVSYTLAANVENLVLNNASHGVGNSLDNVITITNSTNHETLDGGAGNDTLDMGGGHQFVTLIGGTGDDTFIINVSPNHVTIVENSGEGTDTVQASVNYTLDANVENLVLTGTDSINGTGNSLDNNIVGNSGSNHLFGGDGNDTLDGGGGLDHLTGGAGSDTFVFHAATAFSNVAVITDFSTADNDKIDIADLLSGYNPGTDSIDDFVSLVVSGSNTQLKIDLDGTGSGHSMTQIATLTGITGLSVDALVASGELILSH